MYKKGISYNNVVNHRKDIQSLRGVAILFVLLFHFFPKIFPNGYLGVDLFFVISGFLITKIVIERSKKKNFSYIIFIKERFYRIFIPVLFLLIFVALFSFLILLPNDLNKFWNSIVSTIFIVPNIYFYFTGGYFGGNNEFKPLLHLWSIGLELQFYFLYPFILLFFLKNFKNNLIFLFFLIFIFISLLFLFLFQNSFFFFNLPGRLWEFCIGSMIFFIKEKKKLTLINYVSTIVLLFFSLFSSEKYNFYNLILITISAGILIISGKKSFDNNVVINNKIFQFLGTISYSLYLCHWPILVFFKYYFIRELNAFELISIIILTIFLSFFFWLFIENYFRNNKLHKFNYQLTIILIFILFVGLLFNFFSNSLSSRLSSSNLLIAKSIDSNFRCKIKDYFFIEGKLSCLITSKKNNKEIVLLGNSHAQMYGYAFESIVNSKSVNGRIMTLDGCLPTISYNISKNCIEKAAKNLSFIINNNNINAVIIGLNWNHNFLYDKFNKKIEKDIDYVLINSLRELSNEINKYQKKVILIGPISTPEYDFSFDLSRKNLFNRDQIFINMFQTKSHFEGKYKIFLDAFNNEKNIIFIRPHELQCNEKICNYLVKGKSLFSDSNHLSKDGSLLMEELLLNALKKAGI
jgi:peptidoglycan/LPS O-acetylase OafA/YrhL